MFGLSDNTAWMKLFKDSHQINGLKRIQNLLNQKVKNGELFFPPQHLILNAFEKTDFDNVKIVIIGQDPYHGVGEANGLAFSVNDGVKIPPSLKNIFKEIETEFDCPPINSGNLTSWAEQGVFLLNTILTVEKNKPLSHQGIGWQAFTSFCVAKISEKHEKIIFFLWGSNAIQMTQFIDETKHIVLTSVHPSPLSAHKGFFGNNHFKKANKLLRKMGKEPINWTLSQV
jgi:uracil-DNA glycosylase